MNQFKMGDLCENSCAFQQFSPRCIEITISGENLTKSQYYSISFIKEENHEQITRFDVQERVIY